MRTNRFVLPVLALVLFFGVVWTAQATGHFVTTGRSLAGGGAGGGGGGGPVGSVGESGTAGTGSGEGRVNPVAGSLAPIDIKGWMTLQQAADGLGMPVADLVAVIAPPAGVSLAPETAFKDVEKLVPGFSLTELRTRLATATPKA